MTYDRQCDMTDRPTDQPDRPDEPDLSMKNV